MRKRAALLTSLAVAVAVLALGLPAMFFGVSYTLARAEREFGSRQAAFDAGISADIALIVAGVALLSIIAFVFGILVAYRLSAKISEPLVYLAASAEQLGEGQVRPHMERTGIEEIDLVYQELERTAERLAGRLSAERQFAADAAHQLRTPLTALSMRLEEIDYLSTDPEVKAEARYGLEQVERLTNVVDELMRNAQNASTPTHVQSVGAVFAQQAHEWEKKFAEAGRRLVFDDPDVSVLIAPGSLGQIIATLIENSLKYGRGTVTVTAQVSGKLAQIKVFDEGDGVPTELRDDIFIKGFSTGGSTGIGLALARTLAEADGGRLELTSADHAEFTLTLSAVPTELDPAHVLPVGALVSLNSRRLRR